MVQTPYMSSRQTLSLALVTLLSSGCGTRSLEGEQEGDTMSTETGESGPMEGTGNDGSSGSTSGEGSAGSDDTTTGADVTTGTGATSGGDGDGDEFGDGDGDGDDGWDSGGTGAPSTNPGGSSDEPVGVGEGAMPDDEGDVTNPSADVIAQAVYTDGEFIDFRVQFAQPPFDHSATHDIAFCIDLDGNEGTGGSCGTHGDGVDLYLQVFAELDGDVGTYVPVLDNAPIDPCAFTAYETETRTLRVLLWADDVGADGEFPYILTSTFGGSFGTNEWSPEEGWTSSQFVSELPPFGGEPGCW